MRNVKPGHIVPCVCIDAGHYGQYNQSPVVPEYYESDMNWKLHILLKGELDKAEACFQKAKELGSAQAEANLDEVTKKRADNKAFGEE